MKIIHVLYLFSIATIIKSDQECDDAEAKFDESFLKLLFAHPHAVYPDTDQLFDKYCSIYRSSKPLAEKIKSCTDPVEAKLVSLWQESIDKIAGELCSRKKDTITLFKCMSRKYRKTIHNELNRVLGLFNLALENSTKSNKEPSLYNCCIVHSFKDKVDQAKNPIPPGCPDSNFNVTATYSSIVAKGIDGHVDRCPDLHGIYGYSSCIQNHPEVHDFLDKRKDHDFQAGANGQRLFHSYVEYAKKHLPV